MPRTSYTAPSRAAAPAREEEPQGIGDCVEKVARKIAGVAVGLVFGTSGFLTNACAGAANGAVHGARIQEKHEKLAFSGVMTANLAASGIAGGPPGMVLAVGGGWLMWGIEGKEVRERVLDTSDKWVDKTLEKLPGNPDEASLPRRIANGVLGEVVGAAAGAVAGTFGMFKLGQEVGEQAVTRVANRLRDREPAPTP